MAAIDPAPIIDAVTSKLQDIDALKSLENDPTGTDLQIQIATAIVESIIEPINAVLP